MKAHNNGYFFSVTITQRDIEKFKERWPCCTLPRGPIWAAFDKRNGDLLDLKPDGVGGPEGLAIVQDGQNYAAKRLGLGPEARRP